MIGRLFRFAITAVAVVLALALIGAVSRGPAGIVVSFGLSAYVLFRAAPGIRRDFQRLRGHAPNIPRVTRTGQLFHMKGDTL